MVVVGRAYFSALSSSGFTPASLFLLLHLSTKFERDSVVIGSWTMLNILRNGLLANATTLFPQLFVDRDRERGINRMVDY